MKLRGTLTEQDLAAAQWLHIKPRPTYAVVGVLLLAGAVWALWHSFSSSTMRGNGWLLAGSLAALAGFALWLRIKTGRMYRQHRAMHREVRLEPVETGLIGETETGSGTTPWGDFLKWKEGKGLFLLYISDEMFHIIPKRFFQSEGDIPLFRDMLTAKVVER